MTPAASGVGACVDDLPRISPELVLVDPELSRRVRPRVPLRFRRRRPPWPSLGARIAVAAEEAADGHSVVGA
jgi:hypothetical protein